MAATNYKCSSLAWQVPIDSSPLGATTINQAASTHTGAARAFWKTKWRQLEPLPGILSSTIPTRWYKNIYVHVYFHIPSLFGGRWRLDESDHSPTATKSPPTHNAHNFWNSFEAESWEVYMAPQCTSKSNTISFSSRFLARFMLTVNSQVDNKSILGYDSWHFRS